MVLKQPNSLFEIVIGDGPIIATAIHDGHSLRERVRERINLAETERLREEDPFTGVWTSIASTRIIGGRSRFETDLNRPRDQAIYLRPEDAWGLKVWASPPSQDMVRELLLDYDSFYRIVHTILSQLVERYGNLVVLDLHSFNHRRGGPKSPTADPLSFPEVNVGTGTMDRVRWAPIVDRFINDLSKHDYLGRHLDVRENVCFRGGNFSRWIHENFPGTVCSLAVEFKKFFMDEWTGEADERQIVAIRDALAATVPGLVTELQRIN